MVVFNYAFDASLSTINTRVDDPDREAELSRTLTPNWQAFTEELANVARRAREDIEAGDALDGEVNEVQEEKRIGPDPFMVVFESGDVENPKVSRKGAVIP